MGHKHRIAGTMTILLDIDGVLVTTPSWQRVEILDDGFMKFNEKAAHNLQHIVTQTNADIILTSTHRVNFSIEEWKKIFTARVITAKSISKLNDRTKLADMGSRAEEIAAWVAGNGMQHNYAVIDDDTSLHSLPNEIKMRCVITKSLIGIDEQTVEAVLKILAYGR